MEGFLNLADFSDVLSELNTANDGKSEEFLGAIMSEEMKASQRRYEEYILKHEE
jgi:hypothetical protein